MPENEKRPLKVFLCHASADKPRVRELYRYLKRRGLQPWLDAEDLLPGQAWQVEIPKAIETSDAIIICLSKDSINKEGFVQKEIKFALDKALEMPEDRIFLIPARLEECDVPRSLSSYHWVDLFDEGGHEKLMKSLKLRAAQLERTTVKVPNSDETKPDLPSRPEPELLKPAVQPEPEKSVEIKPPLVTEKKEPEKPVFPTPEIEKKPEKKSFRPKIGDIITIIVLLMALLFGLPPLIKSVTPAPTPPTITATLTISSMPVLPSATTISGMRTSTAALTVLPPSETPEPSLTDTHKSLYAPTLTAFPTEITDAKGVSMGFVPAGTFTMGDIADDALAECQKYRNDCQRNWFGEPPHKVSLNAFYMDKYEVTNALYKNCVVSGACRPPKLDYLFQGSKYYDEPQFNNYPVIFVDWNMAKDYCEWRGARLPTEAEWEYAARGTDGRTYPWGEGLDCKKANYAGCVGYTAKVGTYESGKSPFGIYDMAGNVGEFVSSLLKPYPYNVSDGREDLNSSDSRVYRGGGWDYQPYFLRITSRLSQLPYNAWEAIGIRCARSVP